MTTRLHWRASPLAGSLSAAAATALALALILRRPELLAFAAPLLGALAGGWSRAHLATEIEVRAEPAVERCFEHESIRIRVNTNPNGACDAVTLRPILPAGLEFAADRHTSTNARHGSTSARHARSGGWSVRAGRWGSYRVGVEVTARAAGGLLVATAVVEAVRVRVYPRPAPLRVVPRPVHPPDRIGVHIGQSRGEGVEFRGIRPYVAGDSVRSVNWPVSARLGRLHVTERLAERATDVVALVDTYSTAGLDLAVHGAAEVVQAALRRGDRAGVLALGRGIRWLGPDIGRRQFYRIVDAVLDAVPEQVAGGGAGGRVPRAALPPHAFVIAFTPLLDARIGLALQDVRGRGHPILVVDVLRDAPPGAAEDPLTERLWRLERRGLHRDLASLGIPVAPWAKESTLDEVLYPLARRPTPAGRPPR